MQSQPQLPCLGSATVKWPPQTQRRRAASACLNCRRRKVRCNVEENSPCANCCWNQVKCVVRKRKPANRAVCISSGDQLTDISPGRDRDVSVPISDVPEQRKPGDTGTPNVPRYSSILDGDFNEDEYVQSVPTGDLFKFSKMMTMSNITANSANSSSLLSGASTAYLPVFIRALPCNISPTDLSYLNEKGALSIPDGTLRDALLQAFVEYVYPYMPVMDLHEFLCTIYQTHHLHESEVAHSAPRRTSILLVQAVMFSAIPFIDIDHLYEAGFSSRREARKLLFKKTRLIYDFDCELDSVIVIQALLLMTYWHETLDDEKDPSHWIGVAVSLMDKIGINPSMQIAPQKRLWKRIWCSCFIRDVLIATGMRRTPRMDVETFQVVSLTEEDFDIKALSPVNSEFLLGCVPLRNIEMQRTLSSIFMSMLQLSTLIGNTLRTQYSAKNVARVPGGHTMKSIVMLHPNDNIDSEAVDSLDSALINWKVALPDSCQLQGLDQGDFISDIGPVIVQRTLLHLTYHGAIAMLHRPRSNESEESSEVEINHGRQYSQLRVCDSSMHITLMATELYDHGLARFLPSTGITMIVSAAMFHVADLRRSSTFPEAERATHHISQCMCVLNQLREAYCVADPVLDILNAAIAMSPVSMTDGGLCSGNAMDISMTHELEQV